MTQEPSEWLVHDHSQYEELLIECCDAVQLEDWTTAEPLFRELISRLKTHMAMEEEVLYPAYESMSNFPQRPVQSLREEHDNIVRLARDVMRVLKTHDSDHVLDSLLSLEAAMIKHHEREEDVFLPMAGHLLMAQRDELTHQLKTFNPANAQRKWEI